MCRAATSTTGDGMRRERRDIKGFTEEPSQASASALSTGAFMITGSLSVATTDWARGQIPPETVDNDEGHARLSALSQPEQARKDTQRSQSRPRSQCRPRSQSRREATAAAQPA